VRDCRCIFECALKVWTCGRYGGRGIAQLAGGARACAVDANPRGPGEEIVRAMRGVDLDLTQHFWLVPVAERDLACDPDRGVDVAESGGGECASEGRRGSAGVGAQVGARCDCAFCHNNKHAFIVVRFQCLLRTALIRFCETLYGPFGRHSYVAAHFLHPTYMHLVRLPLFWSFHLEML
jgi:hypothetical protein